MFVVFFVPEKGKISRSKRLSSYDAALEAVRKGPSGARFFISFFAADPKNDYQVLEGFVD